MSESLTLDKIQTGGKAALARALARLEVAPDDPVILSLLDSAFERAKGQVIGITGPPGVGKSTLTGALIEAYRARGQSVAVIAVDPSSKVSGGALLGDRIRLMSDPEDQSLFVRSMAARDRLGGLADITVGAMVLMRALFDRVLIETVGVGQSETDVSNIADSVLFCVQPGSGDSLQFMKAGIVEIPHIAVVTKADMGSFAERALSELSGALSLNRDDQGWRVKTLAVAASERKGLSALVEALDEHYAWLKAGAHLNSVRQAQAQAWLFAALKERYGSQGIALLEDQSQLTGQSPFAALEELGRKLEVRLT